MLRPTIVFVTLISTIGGIQLFTEPLLFNSGANAITGGTTRQFQTLTMYLYEKAFTGHEFGYAATIAWVLFLCHRGRARQRVLLAPAEVGSQETGPDAAPRATRPRGPPSMPPSVASPPRRRPRGRRAAAGGSGSPTSC